MKTCSHCGKTWDDNAMHCAECGAALPDGNAPAEPVEPVEAETAPEAVEPIEPAEAEAAPEAVEPSGSDEGGAPSYNSPAPYEPQKKKKSPLRIILPIVAVLLIAGILAAIFLLRGRNDASEDVQPPKNYSVYMKDNDLFFMDDTLEKPIQVGENVFKDAEDHEYVLYFNTNTFNDDGTKFFYAQNIDTEDDTYTLYSREIKNEDAPAFKIAEDVKAYFVLHKNAGVLYVNGDGSIYLHDYSERTKIVSDTEDYRFSKDQKRIAYLTEDDSLYVQEIGGERIKIDADVDEISYADDNLLTIVYLKDGNLFRKSGDEDRQKLDSDVESVIRVYDSGEVYYTKLNEDKADKDEDEEESKPTLYDYVTEPKDQADKDEQIIDKDDTRTKDSRILIRDAKIRTWTREALQNIKMDTDPILSLYCFDGTETALVSKTYSDIYDSALDAPVLAVKCYDNIKINKLSLTEFIDELDKEGHFFQKWEDGKTIYQSDHDDFKYYDTYKKAILGAIEDGAVDYIVSGTTATALDGKAEDYYISDDGTQIMFVADAEESVGTLYQIRLEDGAVLPAETYDEDVYAEDAWGFTKAGTFVYYKNYNEDKSIYDLYVDKTLIDYDVHGESVRQKGKLILYTTDYESDDGTYTLNRYESGEKSKVAEEVNRYEVWDNGTILYLCNPSSSKKYDLYMAKDGVNTNLDFDVMLFLDNTLPTSSGLFVFRWTTGD